MTSHNITIAPRRPRDIIREFEVLDQLSRPVDAGQSQVYLVRRKNAGQPTVEEVMSTIKAGNVAPTYIEQQQICVLKLATPGWEDNLRLEHGYLLRISNKDNAFIELSSGFVPTGDTLRQGPKGFGWAEMRDDSGARLNLPFILTAFYSGGSLLHLLNREQRRPLPARFAVQVALQVTEALIQLQQYDLVHHDISPHNVVFRTPVHTLSENPACVLIDFAAADSPSERRPTRQAGKFHYLPPQRLASKNPMELSWHIDLYSLGVVLYEMLAGELPRRTDVQTGMPLPLPALTDHRQDLSSELVALVTATVSHNPRQWPTSLDEFKTRLAALPELLPPPTPAPRPWHLWATIGGGIGALVLAAVVAFSNAGPQSPPNQNSAGEATLTALPTRATPSPTRTTVPTSTPRP